MWKIVIIENVLNFQTMCMRMYCNINNFHFRLQPACAKNNIEILERKWKKWNFVGRKPRTPCPSLRPWLRELGLRHTLWRVTRTCKFDCRGVKSRSSATEVCFMNCTKLLHSFSKVWRFLLFKCIICIVGPICRYLTNFYKHTFQKKRKIPRDCVNKDHFTERGT